MAREELSLSAELLLLAIDPVRGRLVPHRRRRLSRALRVTHRSGRSGRRWPGRARRHALRELEVAGFVEPRGLLDRGPRLADRPRAAARLDRLRRCIRDDDFPEPRDHELVLLLAWSGVLARRLSKDERRIAARRLRKLVRPSDLGLRQAPLSGTVAEPEWVNAIGRVAYNTQHDLLGDVVSDLATGGHSGLDAVGLGGGGGDSAHGSDGGASHGYGGAWHGH